MKTPRQEYIGVSCSYSLAPANMQTQNLMPNVQTLLLFGVVVSSVVFKSKSQFLLSSPFVWFRYQANVAIILYLTTDVIFIEML